MELVNIIIDFLGLNAQDMIVAIPIGSLISTGGGLLSSIFGSSQRRRARRLERQNVFTPYQENTLLQQNLLDAERRRSIGLPMQVYNNQLSQLQFGLSTGLRSLSRGASTPFNVATLLGGYNRGIQNLNALDAQQMAQNEQQVRQARTSVAQDQRYAYNVNYLQPYMQTRQEIASLRGAGNQNIFGGLSLIGQSLFYGLGNNQQG